MFVAVNMKAAREMGSPQSVVVQMLMPAMEAAEQLIITTEDAEPFVIRATAACKSEQAAQTVKSTLEAALLLGKNLHLAAVREAGRPGHGDLTQATEETLKLAGDVLKTVKIDMAGATVTATASIANFAAALEKTLLPAINEARSAAMRSASTNNLRQLALAMMMYESEHGELPAAVIYGPSRHKSLNASGDGDAATDVPRSWRVEMLPYIEQQELYAQYRLDEPWDSEVNRKVLAKMPAIYRAPEDAAGSTNASYFAILGPATVFQERDGTKIEEISDGASHTFLLVEAKSPIPWTKPRDIPYPDAAYPVMPKLGGWSRPGEFLAAMCDGSVQNFIHLEDEALRRWIEKADGAPLPPPDAAATPVPAPSEP